MVKMRSRSCCRVGCFLAVSAVCVMGCGGAKQALFHGEDERVMDGDYPTQAAAVVEQLSAHLPSQYDWMLVSSYGSLAESISHGRGYGFAPSEDIDEALGDLGTHYGLNPSRLSDYFKDGFDTRSGFAIGMQDRRFFGVFSVDAPDLFRQWFDTLTQEEFGRPVYRDSVVNGRHYTAVDVLHREFSCYVTDEKGVVFLAAEIPDGSGRGGICESLAQIVEGKRLSDSGILAAKKVVSDGAIGVMAQVGGLSVLSQAAFEHAEPWIEAAGLALMFDADKAQATASIYWREAELDGDAVGDVMKRIVKDENRDLGNAFVATSPESAVRLNVDGAVLEPVILKFLDASKRKKYEGLKDKLTQRLLKIDVADQILHNVGNLWALSYSNESYPSFGIAMKEPAKSDSFFGKLNILKRVIPADKAQIREEEGILHAVVTGDIHVGYGKGLLTLAFSASDFEALAGVYRLPVGVESAAPEWTKGGGLISGRIALNRWVSRLTGAKSEVKFQHLDVDSEQGDRTLSVRMAFLP